MTSTAGAVKQDALRVLATMPSLDDESFELVYRHYKPTLVRYAARRGASDPEGVADLALFDGYRAYDKMEARGVAPFQSYLYKAARSHAAASLRQPSPTPIEVLDDVRIVEPPEEQLIETYWLRELVAALPPDQRAVIESRFYDDLPGGSTAQHLGKDRNAVYQLQHRALRRLRKAIFAAAALTALAVVFWALGQTSSSSTLIDNSPITRPEPPVQADDDRPTNSIQAIENRASLNQHLTEKGTIPTSILYRSAELVTSPSGIAGRITQTPTTQNPGEGDGQAGMTPLAAPTPIEPPRAPATQPVTQRPQPQPQPQHPQPTTPVNPPTTAPTPTTTQVPATTPSPTTPPVTYGATCAGRHATIISNGGTIYGTEGPDVIIGTNGKDTIYGLGGDDIICGGNGKDHLIGGDGNDTLVGGSSKDTLDGGPGTNTIIQDG